MPRQARRPVGRVEYFLNIGPVRTLPRQIRHDHRAVARDDGEQVVEVVGDAAGELADGLHFLCLLQLRLETAPFRRLGHEHPDADRWSFGDDNREKARTELSVGAAVSVRTTQKLDVDDRLALLEDAVEQSRAILAKFRLQLAHCPAKMCRRRVTIELSERRIHTEVAQFAVEQREADRRAGQHDVEERECILTFARRCLDLRRHGVERGGEQSELVLRQDLRPTRVVAVGDALRGA